MKNWILLAVFTFMSANMLVACACGGGKYEYESVVRTNGGHSTGELITRTILYGRGHIDTTTDNCTAQIKSDSLSFPNGKVYPLMPPTSTFSQDTVELARGTEFVQTYADFVEYRGDTSQLKLIKFLGPQTPQRRYAFGLCLTEAETPSIGNCINNTIVEFKLTNWKSN